MMTVRPDPNPHQDAPRMERRAQERRGRDRRKAGSRVNRSAPTQSLIKVFGAFGVAMMTAVMTLTILAGEMLDVDVPAIALGLQGGLLASSILLIALGSIEQRLIEVRLELMMMNGGRRAADDRRQAASRRSADGPEGQDVMSAVRRADRRSAPDSHQP